MEFAPEIAYLSMPVKPSDVPIAGIGSWPYDAIAQLDFLGVKVDVPQSLGTTKPLTRYEFAAAIARLLDQKDKRAKDSQKVKELIAKLALEFEPVMSKLGFRIDTNQYIKELADNGIIQQPRYEYLQLDLSYGKQFEHQLQKQIEETIADYAAAWLKSNSTTAADATK